MNFCMATSTSQIIKLKLILPVLIQYSVHVRHMLYERAPMSERTSCLEDFGD